MIELAPALSAGPHVVNFTVLAPQPDAAAAVVEVGASGSDASARPARSVQIIALAML